MLVKSFSSSWGSIPSKPKQDVTPVETNATAKPGGSQAKVGAAEADTGAKPTEAGSAVKSGILGPVLESAGSRSSVKDVAARIVAAEPKSLAASDRAASTRGAAPEPSAASAQTAPAADPSGGLDEARRAALPVQTALLEEGLLASITAKSEGSGVAAAKGADQAADATGTIAAKTIDTAYRNAQSLVA